MVIWWPVSINCSDILRCEDCELADGDSRALGLGEQDSVDRGITLFLDATREWREVLHGVLIRNAIAVPGDNVEWVVFLLVCEQFAGQLAGHCGCISDRLDRPAGIAYPPNLTDPGKSTLLEIGSLSERPGHYCR